MLLPPRNEVSVADTFVMVSGVGPGIDVLYGGPHGSRGSLIRSNFMTK